MTMSAFQFIKCSKHKQEKSFFLRKCSVWSYTWETPERNLITDSLEILYLREKGQIITCWDWKKLQHYTQCMWRHSSWFLIMTCQHREVVRLWFCHMHYLKMESILQIVPVLWGRTHRSTVCGFPALSVW